VWTLLDTAQRDCTPAVQAALLQQLASFGLFQILDQLIEATSQQLEQSAAAASVTAAEAAGGHPAVAALQTTAARLLCFEVCGNCAVPVSCWA
jgi:hypothetical protein